MHRDDDAHARGYQGPSGTDPLYALQHVGEHATLPTTVCIMRMHAQIYTLSHAHARARTRGRRHTTHPGHPNRLAGNAVAHLERAHAAAHGHGAPMHTAHSLGWHSQTAMAAGMMEASMHPTPKRHRSDPHEMLLGVPQTGAALPNPHHHALHQARSQAHPHAAGHSQAHPHALPMHHPQAHRSYWDQRGEQHHHYHIYHQGQGQGQGQSSAALVHNSHPTVTQPPPRPQLLSRPQPPSQPQPASQKQSASQKQPAPRKQPAPQEKQPTPKPKREPKTYYCSHCSKAYKSQAGRSNHEKKCGASKPPSDGDGGAQSTDPKVTKALAAKSAAEGASSTSTKASGDGGADPARKKTVARKKAGAAGEAKGDKDKDEHDAAKRKKREERTKKKKENAPNQKIDGEQGAQEASPYHYSAAPLSYGADPFGRPAVAAHGGGSGGDSLAFDDPMTTLAGAELCSYSYLTASLQPYHSQHGGPQGATDAEANGGYRSANTRALIAYFNRCPRRPCRCHHRRHRHRTANSKANSKANSTATTNGRSNGKDAAQSHAQYPNHQHQSQALNLKVQEAMASLTDIRQAAVQAEFIRQAQHNLAMVSQPMSSQTQMNALHPGYLHPAASLTTSTSVNMTSTAADESSMLSLTVRAPSNGGAANGDTHGGREPPTTKTQASHVSIFPPNEGESVPTTGAVSSVARNGSVRSSKGVPSAPKTGKSKSMLARLRAVEIEEARSERDGHADGENSGAFEDAGSDGGSSKREDNSSTQLQHR